MTVQGLVALLLALPAGSFAGLLADRLPRGEPVLWARSCCRGCGRALGAVELLPLVAWLRQRGRCRCGRTAIGRAPLLAEAGALAIACISSLRRMKPTSLCPSTTGARLR